MSYRISIISGNEDLPFSLESIQAAFSGCDVIEASREGQVTSLVLARAAGDPRELEHTLHLAGLDHDPPARHDDLVTLFAHQAADYVSKCGSMNQDCILERVSQGDKVDHGVDEFVGNHALPDGTLIGFHAAGQWFCRWRGEPVYPQV